MLTLLVLARLARDSSEACSRPTLCSGEDEEEEEVIVPDVEKVDRVALEAKAMLGLALGIEKVEANETRAGERDRAVPVRGG